MNQSSSLQTRATTMVAICGSLGAMFLLGFNPGVSFTEDLGRHLLLGQIILETGSIPSSNYLTYTHGDFPFINHHWLFEVQFYLLHHWFGYNGMIIVKALVGVIALGLAMTAVRPSANPILWWIAGLGAAIMIGSRSHIRPELVTFLCIGMLLWMFEKIRQGKKWPRWVVVLLFCYWANSHIYFIFGIGMAGALALERILAANSTFKSEALWIAAILAGCAINPNGFTGLFYPVLIFENHELRTLDQNSVIFWWKHQINVAMLVLPILSVLVLAAMYRLWMPVFRNGVPWPRLANTIIVIAALAAAWFWIRNLPLLGLAALPLVAEAFGPAIQLENFGRKITAFGALLVTLLTNLLLVEAVLEGSYSRRIATPMSPPPMGLDDFSRYQKIRKLVDNLELNGPVYSNFAIGSLVEYQIWPEKGYVDNRPEAFPASFWFDEYLPAQRLGKEWDALIEKRNFNILFVSTLGTHSGYFEKLEESGEWQMIYLDSIMTAWLRNTAENSDLISSHKFDETRFDSYAIEISEDLDEALTLPWWRQQVEISRIADSVYALNLFGGKNRAWPILKRLHKHFPDLQFIHNMIKGAAPSQETELVEALLKKQSRWPLAVREVTSFAKWLQEQGRTEEALASLRRGILFFPLAPEILDLTVAIELLASQDDQAQ